MKRFFSLSLIGWLATTCFADAADLFLKVDLPLKTPRKKESVLGSPVDKVLFGCWIPEGVKIVRGAIVNPFAKQEVPGKHWQEAARLWDFAVVSAEFDAVKSDEYPLLLTALKEFAKKSGHPEIEHVPLCFIGMSRGGGMSARMAALWPARTIAAAPVCLEVGPQDDATRRIPFMTIFGQKDGKQMALLAERLPVQRKQGALWASVVQWGRGHEFALANNIAIPFFAAAIARRVPPDQDARHGPVTLRERAEADGYLGDRAAWGKTVATVARFQSYTHDKVQACWLPDARVAAVWQAFVSPSKEVVIQTPPGLGDKQPFVLHSANTPVKAVVQVGGALKIESVALYDADVALAELRQPPFKFDIKLGPGIHSLIARVTTADKQMLLSRPHTIVVSRK